MRHSSNRPPHPGHDVAQPDHVRWSLGTSMPTVVLPGIGDDDADARHGQGDRQVVGQADDLRHPQAGLELDLELGDDRTGIDLHDADLVAEIQERPLQEHRPGVDLGLVLLDREGRRRARADPSRGAGTASRLVPVPRTPARARASLPTLTLTMRSARAGRRSLPASRVAAALPLTVIGGWTRVSGGVAGSSRSTGLSQSPLR